MPTIAQPSPSPSMNCRRLALSFAALALIIPCAVRAQPIAADSTITAVTVYVDRAIVTREAAVTVSAGAQEVLFEGLPASLDPNLLQVSGAGTATATILDVRAVSAQLELAANPRLAALLEQARVLQAEVRRLTDSSTVLQQQRDYLDRIKAASVTPPTAEGSSLPSLDQWRQLFVFYSEGLAKTLADQQELERRREDVQARLAAVEREIRELRAPGQRAVRNVLVRLDVARAGNLDLKLNYTVNEASWSPTYDVRVASADKSISLGYAAMVRQTTGEDWKGVRMVLSTARPALGGTPPELSPWYVQELRPEPLARGMGRAMADFAAAPSVAEMDAVQAKAELRSLDAKVETGLTASTFVIPFAADVPADNAPHKVAIVTQPLQGELSHLTVPKLAELAYLRAAVTNTSEFPLIAGPVNLYLDGTYVARAELKTVMPQEKFDLDLGVDDAIAVKRKLVNRLQENTGIISRNQRVTYDWMITVQNNRKTPETIIVRDQMPVAQHEKIAVRLLAPPASEVKRDEVGLLTWTLNLQPGEKRELPLRISVEYPSDFPIGGLE